MKRLIFRTDRKRDSICCVFVCVSVGYVCTYSTSDFLYMCVWGCSIFIIVRLCGDLDSSCSECWHRGKVWDLTSCQKIAATNIAAFFFFLYINRCHCGQRPLDWQENTAWYSPQGWLMWQRGLSSERWNRTSCSSDSNKTTHNHNLGWYKRSLVSWHEENHSTLVWTFLKLMTGSWCNWNLCPMRDRLKTMQFVW